jgi:ubiquinone/menaquinone biosynthesis C-methylase UbiE
MDLLNLNLCEDYFDGIWACAVLLHFNKKDIPRILKSFYKILKPGGLLGIRVKRGKDTKNIIDRLSQNKSRQFTLFYKYELEAMVKKSGLRVIRSRVYNDEARRKKLKWISIWATK